VVRLLVRAGVRLSECVGNIVPQGLGHRHESSPIQESAAALAAEAMSSSVSPLLQCYSCWGLLGASMLFVYLTGESPCSASARFRLPKFSGSEN